MFSTELLNDVICAVFAHLWPSFTSGMLSIIFFYQRYLINAYKMLTSRSHLRGENSPLWSRRGEKIMLANPVLTLSTCNTNEKFFDCMIVSVSQLGDNLLTFKGHSHM